MKTDDLIEALSRNLEPAPKPPRWREAAILAAGFGGGIVLLLTFFGLRPDIGVATIPVLLKAAFSGVLAALCLPAALDLARPGRGLGWRIAGGGALIAVLAASAIIALIGAEPGKRIIALTGGGFPWCLVFIPFLAVPTAIALGALFKAMAPTRLTLSGAAIGAAAGSFGALTYAMYCPVDSVAFVIVWYSVAIGICAAIGALLGGRLLRW
jgi:hypothetical protein